MSGTNRAVMFCYTVIGILERSQTGSILVVRGSCRQYHKEGKSEFRENFDSTIIIPSKIVEGHSFFQEIPLGSLVKFTESGYRDARGKEFRHSFSIRRLHRTKIKKIDR